MKKYQSYKYSGLEWLGDIPEGWRILKMKYVADLYTGNSLNDAQKELYSKPAQELSLPYIATKDISLEQSTVNYDTGICIPSSERRFKVAKANSTLLCVEGGSAGRKIAFIERDIYFVNKLCCFDSKINARYLYYFLQSIPFKTVFKQSLQGLIGGVSITTLSNLLVPVPPIEEQNSITEYLEKTIPSINSLIAGKEAQYRDITCYKTSIISELLNKGLYEGVGVCETEVPYIGSAPSHWLCAPMKYFLKENMSYGANESAESDDRSYPRYIRITDITDDGDLRDETFKSLSPEKAKDYILNPGDILFARSGATVGKTYLYRGGFDACYAGYLIRARCGEKLLPEFLFLYTQTSMYEAWKNSVYIQATIPNISADKYSELRVLVPPLEEQREIVEAANKKCKSMNSLQKELRAQIEDLYKYREAIISEAVTGQIDCRK